jgi:gliding motility-associated lipoprotein GldH
VAITTEKEKEGMSLSPNKIILLAALLISAACEDVRLHTYHSLNSDWSAGDTLKYTYINNSVRDSIFTMDVELRSTSSYPSRQLWIGIQRFTDKDTSAPVDTLCCEIYDSLGRQKGTSTGLLHQISIEAGSCKVAPQDTLHINIIHLMNEPVRDITDVGIRVCGHVQRQYAEN